MKGCPSQFVGKPWRPVADGPEAYDCWGLTRAASLALFGRELPELPEGWQPQTADVPGLGWRELPEAEAGAVCALGNYDGAIKHVCLCLDGGRVLNTAKAAGSHVGALFVLRKIYPVVRFYTWA